MSAQHERKQDERTAVTQAYAVLHTLATSAISDDDMAVTDKVAALRDATRQLTTAMARATAGETALNAMRADAATALSAVSGSLRTRTLTQEAIGRAEHTAVALLQAIDRQDKAPERIYVDPTLPATLQHDGEAHGCHTLEEAVLAWLHLPEDERQQATIQVNVPNGSVYSAAEIDRLHIGAEHQHD